MALPASDDFNRASLGSNWTAWATGQGMQIAGSVGAAGAASGNCCAYWNADVFANDQYSEVIVTQAGSAEYRGVAARCSANSFYGFFHTNNLGLTHFFFKYVGGSLTIFTSGAITVANNDTHRMECSGTTITVKRNGTTTHTQTDTSLTSGAGGICGNSTSSGAYVNSWTAGNLAAGPTPVGLTASSSVSPSYLRALSMSRAPSSVAAASFTRRVGVLRSCSASVAVSYSRVVGILRSASGSIAATLDKLLGARFVSLNASVSGAASFVRRAGRSMVVGGTGSAIFVRLIPRGMAATATGTSALSAIKVIMRTLAASGSAAVSFARRVSLTPSALAGGSATYLRALSLARGASASATPVLLRRFYRVLSAGGSLAVSLAASMGSAFISSALRTFRVLAESRIARIARELRVFRP